MVIGYYIPFFILKMKTKFVKVMAWCSIQIRPLRERARSKPIYTRIRFASALYIGSYTLTHIGMPPTGCITIRVYYILYTYLSTRHKGSQSPFERCSLVASATSFVSIDFFPLVYSLHFCFEGRWIKSTIAIEGCNEKIYKNVIWKRWSTCLCLRVLLLCAVSICD